MKDGAARLHPLGRAFMAVVAAPAALPQTTSVMALIERWWITLTKDERPGFVYGTQNGAEGHAHEFGGRAVEVVPAEQLRGAVEENERLRAALRWYAIGEHLPHPDHSARAQAALRSTTGGQ